MKSMKSMPDLMPNSPHNCEVVVGVLTRRLAWSSRWRPDLEDHVIFLYVARSRGGVTLGRTWGKIVGCQRSFLLAWFVTKNTIDHPWSSTPKNRITWDDNPSSIEVFSTSKNQLYCSTQRWSILYKLLQSSILRLDLKLSGRHTIYAPH